MYYISYNIFFFAEQKNRALSRYFLLTLYKYCIFLFDLIQTPHSLNITHRQKSRLSKAMGRLSYLSFNLFILLAISSVVRSDDECVYTVYVRTGSVIKGGTDSIMTLTLYDAEGYGVRINNLEAWGGLMGPDYNYFERGNLDIFSGKGPCLPGPACKLNITSDGTGSGHGWYCNYIEVTTTGAHIPCAQQLFTIEQWIALDRSPYELTAIRDNCSGTSSHGGRKILKGLARDDHVVAV
ncbi:hypothetical protein ACET3Z_001114 [Daucus carota]